MKAVVLEDWNHFFPGVTSLERLVGECPRMDKVKRILTDRLRRQLVPRISADPSRERRWQTTTW